MVSRIVRLLHTTWIVPVPVEITYTSIQTLVYHECTPVPKRKHWIPLYVSTVGYWDERDSRLSGYGGSISDIYSRNDRDKARFATTTKRNYISSLHSFSLTK